MPQEVREMADKREELRRKGKFVEAGKNGKARVEGRGHDDRGENKKVDSAELKWLDY